jgi:hypothetical protein
MSDRSGDRDLTEEIAALLVKLTEALPPDATDPQRERWSQMRELWIQDLRTLWNTRDRREISSLWQELGGDPQILAHLCADPKEAEQWMRPGSA